MSNFNNYKSSVFAATTTAAEVLPRNNNRTGLMFFNQGEVPFVWYFEDNSTCFFELEANKGMYFEHPPQNAVTGKTDSGTANISIMEC